MKILLVNHSTRQCGVQQFGKRIGQALLRYSTNHCRYLEADNLTTFWEEYNHFQPDLTIFNYYPSTLPWYNENIPVEKAVILHELNMLWGDNFIPALKSFAPIIFPDPTFKKSEYYQQENNQVFTTNRMIPDYAPGPAPERLTIGSFGFAVAGKGYVKLVEDIQNEFDDVLIRLHIPHAAFGDSTGEAAKRIIEECEAIITKPNVDLLFTHDFMEESDLLNWLAGNSLNAFYYEHNLGRGVSSTIDYALAVQRPLAITDSFMFRHLAPYDDILAGKNSLTEILERGTAPLQRYDSWTMENLAHEYDRIAEIIR